MKKLSLVFAGALIVSCGPQGSGSSSNDTVVANGEEFVSISVGMSQEGAGVFALADASSFKMSLEGCASGLEYSDVTSTSLDVYKFDQGCVLKLNSVSIGDGTFVPSGSDPFETYQAGDKATFLDGLSGQSIEITVVTQLDSPISGNVGVAYSFTEVASGGSVDPVDGVANPGGQPLSVSGQTAPAYNVSSVSFVGMTENGAGQFTFELECKEPMSAGTCESLAHEDIRYRLIKDTYDGSLSLAQAQAIFDADAGAEVANGLDAADEFNGGFATSRLNGPDQMHNNPNMLLVIEGAGMSYTYYNIDIQQLGLN